MTVFGARRQSEIGGKPRYLGLMLTAILLLAMLAVAAWASMFLGEGVAGLFRNNDVPAVAAPEDIERSVLSQPETDIVEAEPIIDTALALPETGEELDPDDPAAINVAALNAGLPALSRDLVEDQIDGLSVPFGAEALTPEQAEARYAATGIWQRAPAPPLEPDQGILENFYVASIDPAVPFTDPVTIPTLRETLTDIAMRAPRNPYPADSDFTFDDNGLILPTPEGVLHPDGFKLILGPPPIKPPLRGGEATEDQEAPDADTDAALETDGVGAPTLNAQSVTPEADTATPTVADPTLAAFRPRDRPTDLIEQNERANLGGISLEELRQKRPLPRPEVETEKAEAEKQIEATELAVATSLKPNSKPRNLSALVERARSNPANQVRTASANAQVAPRTVAPRIPSKTSVARSATVKNAINLRKINLIGVYGKPSSRRALVRLANGRYQKVGIGDRIDGGRVSSIGEGTLSYVKSGRNIVLTMPRG